MRRSTLSFATILMAAGIGMTNTVQADDTRPSPPPHPTQPPSPSPIPTPLPNPPPIILNPVDAVGEYVFGTEGYSGQNGADGIDGVSGLSQVYSVNGQSVSIYARGGNGTNGTRGGDASDAYSCYQPGSTGNLIGARGGNGGHGGRGGNAGYGGHTTLYFTSVDQLRSVYIDASPGYPGYGDPYSSRNGRGCYCQYLTWRTWERKFEKLPDGRIQEYRWEVIHRCHPGRDGVFGNPGPNGRTALAGGVTLIQSATPLPKDVLSSELMDMTQAAGNTVVLRKNIFERIDGATALLAPGSVVQDTYNRFVETRVVPVRLVWAAKFPVSDFGGVTVSYRLTDNAQMARMTVTDAWTTSQTQMLPEGQIITIDRAVRIRDVARLTASISGSGANTILTITDEANVSDLISTQIWAKLESNGVFNHERFKGDIPASAVVVTGNRMVINLYQLWEADNAAKDLKSGKKVNAELKITRTMGPHSTVVEFDLDGVKLK